MSGLDPAIAAIDAEAAAWCVRMASDQVTLEDERAFAAWLAADPEHRARYDAHAGTWGGIGALREDPEGAGSWTKRARRLQGQLINRWAGLYA